MNNKQVLVTGGTGFVGSYLLRYLLQKNYKIKAIKRATSPMRLVADIADQIDWVEGDILDVPFLEKITKGVHQIYHVAAVVSFDPRDQQALMKVNIEGTANIVNVALCNKVEKLVHVSSVAAIGHKESQPHIDEAIQWENSKDNSNYAISKFKAEAEVWRGIQEGLNAVIINPSIILGAGYWNIGSCELFTKVYKGLSYYPSGSFGFIDVRDVAQIAIQLMESEITAERFILNAKNYSFQLLLKDIAKVLDKRPPRYNAPNWLLFLLVKLEWLRTQFSHSKPLLTSESVKMVEWKFYYNNDKIKKELDYQFIPLEQTIQQTALALKESKKNKQDFGVFPL